MAEPEFRVDFPTLFVVLDWIEAHAVIPDGQRHGEPFELYGWQAFCTASHYRIRESAKPGDLVDAFTYRRSQVVMPQKSGKGPWSATIVLAEAVGPTLFNGWAVGGELYRCSDHGCPCGFWYEYEPGEPMGVPRAVPNIQMLATCEDQVQNAYRPLQSMIRNGPLVDVLRVGENFIRIGDRGRIDVVSSSAQSRLGQPITFALQDETGLYTDSNKMRRVADTQRRGLAGMQGRALETTNAWDPSENSTAQRTHEARAKDVFRYFPQAPASLSFKDKRERRRIFRAVYAGSAHINLNAIEAEVAELVETDPAQAERFFGNRIVAGTGAWVDPADWAGREAQREVKPGTRIVLGFDGSDSDDWTAIRAQTMDGYQFTPTYGPNALPCVWNPADYEGQVPRLEVAAAVDELMRRYDVAVMYADPPFFESEIDAWAEQYGERKVIRWHTRRVVQMHAAAERMRTDITKSDTAFTHDGCPIAATHVGNARTAARPGDRYVLRKETKTQKIDLCVTSILANEAMNDVVAAGKATRKRNYFYSA